MAFATLLVAFLPFCGFTQSGTGVKVKFNGFGDITAGIPFGDAANATSAALFNKYGDEYYPYGMRRGINVHGVDFLTTVYLTDAIKMQTEVAIYGARAKDGGNMAAEVDRCYIDYSISDFFGLQAGLIYTPVGYVNRNLYSRAWLMNSAYIFQAVEQSAGLVQSHFVGGCGYGTLARSANGMELTYMVGAGMPRPNAPTEQIFNSQQLGYQFTGLLEGHIIKDETDIKIGLSGYSSQIHTYYVANYGDRVDIEDPNASPLLLQETGFNPYFVLKSNKLDFMAEYHYVVTDVLKGDYPNSTTTLNCLTTELALPRKLFGRRFAPYIRYDYMLLPADSGPYYGLRLVGDGVLTKDYSPNFKAAMVGIAYDVASFNRIKLEYIHHFDGPYKTDGIFLQTAFGF